MARLRSRNRDITVTAPSHDRTNTSARVSPTPTLTPTLGDRRSARERSALVVACSECQAEAGAPCLGVRALRNGEPWERWAVHRPRWEMSRNVEEVDEDDDPPWLRAWLSVKMRMPSARQRDVIEAYLRVFDETGPERAARVFLGKPDDPMGALLADLEEFRNGAKVDAEKAEAEAKERRREQRRGFRKGSVEYELAQQLYAKSEGRL
jgi:hypothetical protein